MSTIINAKVIPHHNGHTLSGLEVSIRFHGAVYFKDIPEHTPIQLSILLPDEWAELLPVVYDISKDKLAASQPLNLAMFPFLPLPSHFDPDSMSQWRQLAEQIEHCLLADPLLDSKHPRCYWFLRELFWMAFVAACPDFPHGNWPRWNGLIAMEGDFISRWVLKDEDDEADNGLLDTPLAARRTIWEQFRSIVSDSVDTLTT